MLAEYGKRRKRTWKAAPRFPASPCEWPVARFTPSRMFSAHLGEGKNAAAKNCTELSKLLLEKRT